MSEIEKLIMKWRKFADADYEHGMKLSDAKKEGQRQLLMAGQCLAYATCADELESALKAYRKAHHA
jgi:hypothetical protein